MEVGDGVPPVKLKDQHGEPFEFSELIGRKPFVVFFYPKDFTPGCTKEACNFRDSYEDFKVLGAEVIGISSDSESSHSRFITKYNLPYTLLSDSDKKARNAFGVKASLFGLLPGRETFVFDQEGKLVEKWNSMDASVHMPMAIEALRKIQK